MAKRTKKWLWVTPAGHAMYPYLATPDTRFGNDYKVDLVFTGETAKQVKEYIDSLKDEVEETLGAKEVSNKIYTAPYIEEEGGNIRLRTKQKAILVTKTGEAVEMKVGTFDAKVQPIEPTSIQNGDLIKAEVVLVPYAVGGRWGITARLKNVQLLAKNNETFFNTRFKVEEQYISEDNPEDAFKELLDNLEDDLSNYKIEF